jgi:hypothetical protein
MLFHSFITLPSSVRKPFCRNILELAKKYGNPAYQSQQSDVLHAIRGSIPALLLCNRSTTDTGVDVGQCISFVYSVCVQCMSSGNHSIISAGILLVVSLLSHVPLDVAKSRIVSGAPDPSEFAQSFVGIIVDFPSNLPSLTGHVMSYFESLVGRPVPRLAVVLFSDFSPEVLDASVELIFRALNETNLSSTAALIFGRILSGAVMVSHPVFNRLLKIVAAKLHIQDETSASLLSHPVVTCTAFEASVWITVLCGALEHSGDAALPLIADIALFFLLFEVRRSRFTKQAQLCSASFCELSPAFILSITAHTTVLSLC